MEFNAARKKKKPQFLFISKNEYERKPFLNNFIKRIMNFTKGNWCYSYKTIADLQDLVYNNLIHYIINSENINIPDSKRKELESLVEDDLKYKNVLKKN